MAQHKEVVKILDNAMQFQKELELAQAQHGVLVLDIYNAEWGNCKALNETFRRLWTDAGDDIYVRFFAVECNQVLETYRNPDPHHAAQMKIKAMEYHPDTCPECWEPILESRQKHAKPYFVYYKEGKIRGHQEGVDTPKIYKTIRGLCVPQKPAKEFITNESLMAFWCKYFSEVESEVTSNELFRALVKERVSNEEFSPEEQQSIEVFADAKKGVITAEGLQKWTGDRDFMETVAAVIPDAAPIEPYPEDEQEDAELEAEEVEEGSAKGEGSPSPEGEEKPESEEAVGEDGVALAASEESPAVAGEEGLTAAEQEAPAAEEVLEAAEQEAPAAEEGLTAAEQEAPAAEEVLEAAEQEAPAAEEVLEAAEQEAPATDEAAPEA